MTEPILLQTLKGEMTSQIPFWFMRQAGRYLPEYQEMRKGFSNFLEFCYTPDAACEVTLQPIRRFDMDAAILFCDILVIPDALGQEVSFVKGEGPKLKPVENKKDVVALSHDRVIDHLQSVFQTIQNIKQELPKEKALIGFSGSPWTLACYMIEGQGSRDFAKARAFIFEHPESFARLMRVLVSSISDYCIAQIEAGADVIQLFDSWAGVATASQFDLLVIQPTKQIVANIKAKHPHVPIIGFAKGAGVHLAHYANQTGVDAIGVDQHISLHHAADIGRTLQGNLDNVTLASSKEDAVKQAQHILQSWSDVPFIFNLGHGILPHTPIENVEAVVKTIREFKR